MVDAAHELVFVYGTLRQGEANHGFLRGAKYLGMHRTERRYTMHDLGAYPAIVEGGATAVIGEVYAVDNKMLARLDRLEDYPEEYSRGRVKTPFGWAWIYLYYGAPKNGAAIASGDWCDREYNKGR